MKRTILFESEVQVQGDDEDTEDEVLYQLPSNSASESDSSDTSSSRQLEEEIKLRKLFQKNEVLSSSCISSDEVVMKEPRPTSSSEESELESDSDSDSERGEPRGEPREEQLEHEMLLKENVNSVVKIGERNEKDAVIRKAKERESDLHCLNQMKFSDRNCDENITQIIEVDGYDEEKEAEVGFSKERAFDLDTDDEDWIQDEELQMATQKRNEIVNDSNDEWFEEKVDKNILGEDENDEVGHHMSSLRHIWMNMPGIKKISLASTYSEPAQYEDPTEIFKDYELPKENQQPFHDSKDLNVSPFAQVPRPMVALAADALSRKRKRTVRKEMCESISAATLLNVARVGSQFGDHFVESMLVRNGKALQGIVDCDFVYDKSCWSSLPIKRKPVANWRFVFEHVRKWMGSLKRDDAVYSPLTQKSFKRITKRLKSLYGYTTQHEEHDIFETKADPDIED
ncbi:hypothetical protein CCR75_001216 [Bremia lactucae]|uniref:Uncharacterized protein n=1 Tax=Bremia lactucae TaxID=4779 RepID=A0A976FPN2_BRELC|nr:hypothetical protein CCR75_001216 [Bremia lactucae]